MREWRTLRSEERNNFCSSLAVVGVVKPCAGHIARMREIKIRTLGKGSLRKHRRR